MLFVFSSSETNSSKGKHHQWETLEKTLKRHISPCGAASSEEHPHRLHTQHIPVLHWLLDASPQAFLCSFQMIALLIKHNLLTISALSAAPLTPHSLTLTHPHPSLAPSPGPVAKATGISFLKCQFALLSSRFPAITSLLSLSLFLSPVSFYVPASQIHTYTYISYTHPHPLLGLIVLHFSPFRLYPLVILSVLTTWISSLFYLWRLFGLYKATQTKHDAQRIFCHSVKYITWNKTTLNIWVI